MAERRRAAVLGSPVGHSLSPLIHRAAYRALGLDGWSYDAHEVGEAGLAGFLAGLDGTWAGLSLTMPLKQAVLPLLDAADDTVEAAQVCNTLVLGPGGPGGRPRRWGANTDVHGIVASLVEGGAAEAAGAGPAHILGGGATAASAVAALGRLGYRAVTAHVRDPARATPATAAADAAGIEASVLPWPGSPHLAAALAPAAVVVATTPPTAADAVASALSALRQPGTGGPVAPTPGVLLDVAYDPWPSRLSAAWAAAGGTVVPGALMLLHQAAEQVRLMTGREPPLSAMRVALAEARAKLRG